MLRVIPLLKRHSLFIIIFVGIVILRFWNLGYSDYAGDEIKAMFRPSEGTSFSQFFLSQRKGPGQFLVSYIPYLLTGNYRNELVTRLPFTLANIGAMFILYLFLLRMTKKIYMSALGVALVGFCGFIVGFSRIVQYQNLNLLFSILSLYFYSLLNGHDKKPVLHFFLGTFFWGLSFLSHWDSVFFSPINLYFIITYITSRQTLRKTRVAILLIGIFSFFLLGEVFFFPYLNSLHHNVVNTAYVNSRVAFKLTNPTLYKMLIELYSPFVTFWLYITGLAFFLIVFVTKSVVKKLPKFYALVFVWFTINFLFFLLFFKDPRTHIYNFVLPGLILCAIGFAEILEYFYSRVRWAPLKFLLPILLSIIIAFTFYQDYVLFIDFTGGEYPYTSKNVWIWKTTAYWNNDKYNSPWELPWFGFPHARFWNTVVSDMKTYAKEDYLSYTYISSEKSVIAHFYTDLSDKFSSKYFAIGVRNTTDYQDADWKFDKIRNKIPIKSYYLNGKQVVNLYVVYGE